MGLISIISLLFAGGVTAKDNIETQVNIAEPSKDNAKRSNCPIYFDGKNHRYIPTGEICFGRLMSVKSMIYPHLNEDIFIYEVRKNWQLPKIVWMGESPIEKDEQIQKERAIKEGKDIYYNRKAGVYRYLDDDKYYTYMGKGVVFEYDKNGKYIISKVLTEDERDKVTKAIMSWKP